MYLEEGREGGGMGEREKKEDRKEEKRREEINGSEREAIAKRCLFYDIMRKSVNQTIILAHVADGFNKVL